MGKPNPALSLVPQGSCHCTGSVTDPRGGDTGLGGSFQTCLDKLRDPRDTQSPWEQQGPWFRVSQHRNSLCAPAVTRSKPCPGGTRVRALLAAPHPKTGGVQWIYCPSNSKIHRAVRSWSPPQPRKAQLNPFPAGEGNPGGSCRAWCIIKTAGNGTIKPARFPALIPDQRGFGKEHPRLECLSQPDPVSF